MQFGLFLNGLIETSFGLIGLLQPQFLFPSLCIVIYLIAVKTAVLKYACQLFSSAILSLGISSFTQSFLKPNFLVQTGYLTYHGLLIYYFYQQYLLNEQGQSVFVLGPEVSLKGIPMLEGLDLIKLKIIMGAFTHAFVALFLIRDFFVFPGAQKRKKFD